MPKRPLLAELHAHTTWSDGQFSPAGLIDRYGRAGFDVLAITVHSSAAVHTEDAVVDRLRSKAQCALMRIAADRVAA
jgi:predicted metal-dependent phosphoesterase TrpH